MYRESKLAGITAVTSLLILMNVNMALASPLAVTNTFAPNTPATAASVNQNFTDVESSVNDNDGRITTNAANIGTNAGNIGTNTSDIADNFTLINDNTGDIADLQNGQTPATRTFIDIDCDANADVLLQPPYSDNFYPYTTFNITGDCNGPIYISSDGVRLVGTEPARGASIVLPNPTTYLDESYGTVFVDGGHDVRVENLKIDASQWGTFAIAQGTDAAGVYARNAFVRLIDVDIVGGIYGMSPFRNALIRLQGTINITEFVLEGITVGDKSVVTARGQVNISSSRTDGNYMNGVGAFRSGNADFRAGLVVTVPDELDNTNPPNAVESGENSVVRIRDSGTINLTGRTAVTLYRSGNARIEGGSINGNIFVNSNSGLTLKNITHPTGSIFLNDGNMSAFNNSEIQDFYAFNNSVVTVSGNTTVDGDIMLDRGSSMEFRDSTQLPGFFITLRSNSNATINGSSMGQINLDMGSTLDMGNGSSFEGGQIDRLSIANIYDSSTSQNLTVNQSFMDYTAAVSGNYLNGNTVYECNAISSFVGPNVAPSGTVVNGCP